MKMTNELLTLLGHLGVVTAFCGLGAMLFRRDLNIRWLVAALVLYVIYDALLTRVFFAFPNFPPDSSWNWLGKTLAIAGMLVIAAHPKFGYRKTGITFSQRNGFLTPFLVFLSLSGLFF